MIADISIHSNLQQIERSLTGLAMRQIPFARSMALTSLAKVVQGEETKAFNRVFDRPTPFTTKAVGVKAARKTDLTAVVYVKDTAAAYLAPFEFGGAHKARGARSTFNPKGAPVNQYGNLPKNVVARLKARSDVFVGEVKTKKGEVISGVWQRPYMRGGSGKVRGNSKLGRGYNTTGQLKLLIRFTDPQPVTQHLGYRDRAKRAVNANFDVEFSRAMTKALASATR